VEISRVLVALDPTIEVIREAGEKGAELLVTHHPLIFDPLRGLDLSRPAAAAVAEAIGRGVAVFACHTNADVARPGVSDALAEALEIASGPALAPQTEDKIKVVSFVPPDAVHPVLEAMATAGAGVIGGYDVCSFRSPGIGTIRPSVATKPKTRRKKAASSRSRGTRKVNEVEEDRLEMIVPRESVTAVVEALRVAHPYEEPVVDVYALETRSGVGYGRVGELPKPTTAAELLASCRERLGGTPRLVGDPEQPTHLVAVCAGSGAALLADAITANADAFVTGDVKHHQALDARAAGLVLIDAGHHATEWPFVEHLAARLVKLEQEAEVLISETATDPFRGA